MEASNATGWSSVGAVGSRTINLFSRGEKLDSYLIQQRFTFPGN